MENNIKKIEAKIIQILKKEGGAAGLKPIKQAVDKMDKPKGFNLNKTLSKMANVEKHKHSDYILTPLNEITENILEMLNEKLCPKGKAYVARRKAAGEKHGAYLMGRAVKVCKGQMSGKKKKKKTNEAHGLDKEDIKTLETLINQIEQGTVNSKKIKDFIKVLQFVVNSNIEVDQTKDLSKNEDAALSLSKKNMSSYASKNEINLSELKDLVRQELEEKKKGKCKPSKGKRFAKRVNGKCRSFGQKGKASDGGDRIRPGTAKANAYCARSAKIKKCKNPPCANTLSRKKWKCQGSRSVV